MSKLIAEIRLRHSLTEKALVYVHASLGGVEITADESTTFSPTAARAYADALVKAAVEVESMRDRVRSQPPEVSGYRATDLAADIASWEP